MNTFYTAFEVLKTYVEGLELTITNFTPQPFYNRCVMWVAANDSGYTHFICEKHSPTQFVIYAYNNDGEQTLSTGFDYADVNTPPQVQAASTDNEA